MWLSQRNGVDGFPQGGLRKVWEFIKSKNLQDLLQLEISVMQYQQAKQSLFLKLETSHTWVWQGQKWFLWACSSLASFLTLLVGCRLSSLHTCQAGLCDVESPGGGIREKKRRRLSQKVKQIIYAVIWLPGIHTQNSFKGRLKLVLAYLCSQRQHCSREPPGGYNPNTWVDAQTGL